MKHLLAGIDIGGTKCAVSLGSMVEEGREPRLLGKRTFPTPESPKAAVQRLSDGVEELLRKEGVSGNELRAIGISCGGPLEGDLRVDFPEPLMERPLGERASLMTLMLVNFTSTYSPTLALARFARPRNASVDGTVTQVSP